MHHSFLALLPFSGLSRLRPDRTLPGLILKTDGALRAIPREDLSPAGVWVEDHSRLLMDEAEALCRDARGWPSLPAEENREPRVLRWARRVTQAGEGAVDAALILRCLREETETEWTEAEWSVLRPALGIALMERIRDGLSALLREAALRARAERLAKEFAAGRSVPLPQEADVLGALLEALERREDGDALRRADEMLSRSGLRAEEISREQREKNAQFGLEMGREITALRRLGRLPLGRIAERMSPVAQVLRCQDTYRRMDGESREMYRQACARLARRWRVRETAVARAACALCQGKDGAAGEAGYYLLEKPEMIGEYLLKRKPGLFARHRQGLFVLPLYAGAGAALAAGALLGAPWYVLPLIPLCVSEGIRAAYYPVLRRCFPARRLPRLRVKKLSEGQRVLVVIPTLLTSRKQAMAMARQLSVLRHAHPDPAVRFMLLADFADADAPEEPGDEEILWAARQSVEALNRRGGGCYYFQRARSWDQGQRQYTGRERKRGALEALNRLLTEGRCRDSFLYTSCDPDALRGQFAYVITLDADTFLPAGAIHKLVGAMEHPLQKDRVGVIQPRMETAPDTVRTRVQLWLGGRGGAALYHLPAQDVYQDVFGRGSFVGKGIYQPGLWLKRLEGNLPAGRLLSHDLIEGEMAVSALMDDVVLYDGHPSTLAGWQKRLERWTRGDWQLLPFLRDRHLPLLSRHKILDNLRRSLVPAAQVGVLLASAALRSPWLALLGLPWPIRGMGRHLALLPGKAYTLLEAAVRALYRQFISHRRLLSWVTAAQGDRGDFPSLPSVLVQIAAGVGMTALSLLPGIFAPAALLGMAWLASPLLLKWVDGPARRPRALTPAMRDDLHALARDTWRFFADWVNRDSLYLPPDNVQLDPDRGPAMRTSPTNIGLYLLSCCAAREMGLIATAEWAGRIRDTLSTLERLDTWKGHFYNWYDLSDGAPLPPRFVSTVDSGNLAGCLMACAQLLRRRLPELTEAERDLPARLDALAARMDFSALYDAREHLMRVGWDVQAGTPTPAHYDTLASEARLSSYIAVMTGQAPRKHWARLGRAVTRAGGGAALLSWGGTLFEYLMPDLLLPLIPGTLLGEGCLSAVRAQMSADPTRPFGISESGYYAFDAELNYQYRAFGLPALALSGETAGRVIAPYASVLALPFFPRAAADNIARMRRLGWQGEYGLYEAADYSPQRVDGTVRIIKSHMAHHQGMILCALCNALCDQALVRAFMTPPAARACADLLWERAPGSARRRSPLPLPREEKRWAGEARRVPRGGLPLEAHVLSGGGTTWVLTAQGQGFLAHRGMLVTRFQAEAGSQTGPQFYLRDGASGALARPSIQGEPTFEAGQVRFSLRWRGWTAQLSHAVDPLTGMAVSHLQVRNNEKTEREMEAVSFLEVAQDDPAVDAAHPNFQDLSVQVTPWGSQGLMSRRLPREAEDQTPLIGHTVVGDAAALCRQGDRALFLGREGTYARPAQLTLPADDCLFRTGDVIAPCLSLRAGLRVGAGEQAELFFVTCMAPGAEALDALRLTPDRLRAAFSLADTHARMGLRHLGMEGGMLGLYQRVLGATVFSGQPHQAIWPSAHRRALWRMGVSGDWPVLLVNLAEGPDQALIRHALRAHAWMREQGVMCDLVFFCPEEGAYHRPCRDAVTRLMAAGPSRSWTGEKGGVTLASGNETEAREAESLARLTLRSGQTLHAQLSALRVQALSSAGGHLSYPVPRAVPDILENNIFGGFTADNAYCVYAPAPSPWHNLLCGPGFGTLVCETGILHSYAGNSRLGRLTRLSPDVHRGLPAEEIYLLDGGVWPLARCAATHEPGVTEYRNQAGAVEAQITVFSHPEQPLGVRTVTLRSPEDRDVQIAYLVRFALGEKPEDTRCRADGHMAFAMAGSMEGIAWAALEGGKAQALSAPSVFGLKGEAVPPALLGQAHGAGSVAVITVACRLPARRAVRLTLALGFARQEEEAAWQFDALLREGAAATLQRVRIDWEKRLTGITLFSENPDMNRMMNRWLPYQTRASRLMARLGPYQQGGAIGFRDQLQDLLALLFTEPETAREHILLCAAHQYAEGDVQHWWHPPRRGVRTRISDDRLFLPYMTAQYVRVTGDTAILQEQVPYLLSPPLSAQEEDRYEEPENAARTEPLLWHGIRAIDAVGLGDHGLPLMGGGDWNDGMNRVGGRTGESVWLGFFLVMVLKDYAPLCPPDIRKRYDGMRRSLLSAAENAWTGQWYLRAWYGDGRPLGGPDTAPPRIDLISQCFAVLAGAPRDHARTALKHAVDALYDRAAGMVKLLDPPFAPEENAGYIGAYLPGVRENGGQYTHAVPWLVMALCRIGEYGLAREIAGAVLPSNHAGTRERAMVYRVEPYVLAADVYGGENRGRGGWTWYTGSAAWLYYAVLTALLGFEKAGDRLRLVPCPSPDEEEYTLTYRYGNARYLLTAAPDVLFPTLDGARLEDGWVPLTADGRTHEARFPLRKS